jgi:4-amino-4-deoxy-L-arabinose transferase
MHKNKFFIAACLVVFITLSMLAFAFQGSRGIWQPDEGYYVGTSVVMLNKDTLLIPYIGENEIFLDKPPLIYWGIIAGLKILGHNEFAVRFFNAICFLMTSIVTGLIGWKLFKDKTLGLISALVYATMAVPFYAGNFITPDTPLTLWATTSILFFLESLQPGSKKNLWKMLLCLAVGLGFLAKGPAVLIPLGGMFIFLCIRKQVFKYFITPWAILGLLIFIVVGLGWYIWISIKLPGAMSYLFDSQIWGRLISKSYKRNPGLLGAMIYIPILVFGSLPWSSIWIEKRKIIQNSLFCKKWWKTASNRPVELFLVCWFFIPLLILCLASSKLGFYTLPIFPALAIATAKLWRQKLPDLNNLQLKTRVMVFKKPAILFSVWAVMLITSKLAISYYPTPNDMRQLWAELKDNLPKTDYEFCTVGNRADGLLFYGIKEIEHLTDKKDSYPTFSENEPVDYEIDEFASENEHGVLLARKGRDVIKISEALKKNQMGFSVTELPHKRLLFTLKKNNSSTISE